MLSKDYKPRLDFGTIQTNVIMTQIRAERQKTAIKIIDPVFTPAKQRAGRRHFQKDLYRITDITNQVNNDESRSQSKSTGKKILNKSQSMNHLETSKSVGKKHFDEKFKRTALVPVENKCKRVERAEKTQAPKTSFGKRRYDHSPHNQHRQSHFSPLKWNQHLF